MESPLYLRKRILDAYLRYYDTAFRLQDQDLMRERRSLLEGPADLASKLFIEPVLPYDGQTSVESALKGIDVLDADQFGRLLTRAVFGDQPSDFLLRSHQAEALQISLRDADARHVVVTSGTGSGKTECFLLPIFARLLREGQQAAPATDLVQRWWESDPLAFTPARSGNDRPAAVRALIIYPTNALVEDQMSRLRRAVGRCWDKSHPLWFGRYTGRTQGMGPPPTKRTDSLKRVASEIRALEQERLRLEQLAEDEPSIAEMVGEWPNPSQGEQLTRWDMLGAPPDILVTNFSMLNVSLLARGIHGQRLHARDRRVARLPGNPGKRSGVGASLIPLAYRANPGPPPIADHCGERVIGCGTRGPVIPQRILWCTTRLFCRAPGRPDAALPGTNLGTRGRATSRR